MPRGSKVQPDVDVKNIIDDRKKRVSKSHTVEDAIANASALAIAESKNRSAAAAANDKDTFIKTITYDEYLNAGIPEALLKGLGFVEESSTPDAEEEEDVAEMVVEQPSEGISSARWYGGGGGSGAALMSGYGKPIGHVIVAPNCQTAVPVTAISPLLAAQSLAPLVSLPTAAPLLTVPSKPRALGGVDDVGKILASSLGPAMAAAAVVNATKRHAAAALDSVSPPKVSSIMPATVSALQSAPTASPDAKNSVRTSSTSRPARSRKSPAQKTNENEAARQAAVAAAVDSAAVARTPPAAHSHPSPLTRNQSGPRIVTKGNIMYERLPTGEVVASLVKKPTSTVASEPPLSQPATGPPTATPRTGPGRYVQAHTRCSQPLITELDRCPDGYAINDVNVVAVLDESVRATQTMRTLLMSLRDDLRRVGGATAATSMTPEQARKRREVANKLMAAYGSYKKSIDDIENVRFLDRSETPESSDVASNSRNSDCASVKSVSDGRSDAGENEVGLTGRKLDSLPHNGKSTHQRHHRHEADTSGRQSDIAGSSRS